MNPSTAETFGPMPLPPEVEAGDRLTQKDLIAFKMEQFEKRASRGDRDDAQQRQLKAALEHLRQGNDLVAVDAAVVQRARLGDRELRRRKQRR